MRRDGARRVLATVLFADVVASTEVAAEVGDRRWRALLERHHEIVRRQLRRYDGTLVDAAGDGVFATFADQEFAVRCGCAIADASRELGIEVRTGLHVGHAERTGRRVRGMAVHIGARVMALAGPGEVLVSGVLKELVPGSGFSYADRGSHRLKGVPEAVQVFAVVSVDGTPRAAPDDAVEARRRRDAVVVPPLLGRGRRRTRLILLGATVGLVAVGVGLLTFGGAASDRSVQLSAPSLLHINARTSEVVGDTPIADPGETEPAAVPPHQVWVLSHPDQVISIVDARSDTRIGTIGGFGGQKLGQGGGFAVLYWDGSVWVTGQNNTVTRIDPTTRRIEATVSVPGGSTLLAAGFRHIWVLSHDLNRVYAIDPTTNRARAAGQTGSGTAGIAVGEGAVWVVNATDDSISKIDPVTGKAKTILVGFLPAGIGLGYGSVWVSNTAGSGQNQTVSQIDPATDRVTHTIRVGKLTTSLATDIAPADGSMWVTCPTSHTIVRINPTTSKVTDRIHTRYAPVDLTTAYGSVWVTLQQTFHTISGDKSS